MGTQLAQGWDASSPCGPSSPCARPRGPHHAHPASDSKQQEENQGHSSDQVATGCQQVWPRLHVGGRWLRVLPWALLSPRVSREHTRAASAPRDSAHHLRHSSGHAVIRHQPASSRRAPVVCADGPDSWLRAEGAEGSLGQQSQCRGHPGCHVGGGGLKRKHQAQCGLAFWCSVPGPRLSVRTASPESQGCAPGNWPQCPGRAVALEALLRPCPLPRMQAPLLGGVCVCVLGPTAPSPTGGEESGYHRSQHGRRDGPQHLSLPPAACILGPPAAHQEAGRSGFLPPNADSRCRSPCVMSYRSKCLIG